MSNLELLLDNGQFIIEGPKRSFLRTFMGLLVFIVAVFLMLILNVLRLKGVVAFVTAYGTLNVAYLLLKMGLSAKYQPFIGETPNLTVSVVVPAYNEKSKDVKLMIKSIQAQTHPVKEIFYVDDGSKEKEALELVREMAQADSRIVVHSLEKNSGKRHAQIWGFERCTGQIIVTVDSDCVLSADAVSELLKPFSNRRVMATTGHVNAKNKDASILSKLIDMRYENAFRVERAAQSTTGNVLVCSGPLSAYRRHVIMNNIDRYGNQVFLGKHVQFGDDRCLTNYAIEMGKTVYQSTARCITDVPSTLGMFLRQQVRWNKSFFRESIKAFGVAFRKKKLYVFLWVLFELLTWVVFSTMLIFGIFIKPFLVGAIVLLYYLGYISLSAYARNVYYVLKHPLSFLMAPLYGLVHIILLLPLRLYALLTINVTKWGTR